MINQGIITRSVLYCASHHVTVAHKEQTAVTHYHRRSNSAARCSNSAATAHRGAATAQRGAVLVVMPFCVCQCDNSPTVCDVIMKFLWEEDMVKNLDYFENGCIPMHCGAQAVT